MKLKTLLFGAGQGSLTFMKNTSNEREFVGFLDNDASKVGKTFNGISIYSPNELSTLHYDEVVITTQWALEVQRQLIEEICADQHKVIVPQKNQLKNATPFTNIKSLELGRDIISKINALAIERNIPLVVDFGTLLGLVRDQDIIPWDDDIDFSAPIEYAEDVEKLLIDFKNKNSKKLDWIIQRVTDKQNNVAGLLLKFIDPKSESIEFTTSLCFRKNVDGNAIHLPSLGMWYAPVKYFDSIEVITWRENLIQVPFSYLDYLTFQYGEWQTPKKDFQLSDYANLRTVEFVDIQQAGLKAKTISMSV